MSLKRMFNRWRNGDTVNRPCPCGETPLTLAVKSGDDKLVKSLLDLGAYPDLRNKTNETPLYLSITVGHFGIFQQLIEAGASIAVLIEGRSLYTHAKERGLLEFQYVLAGAEKQDRDFIDSFPSMAPLPVPTPMFPPDRSMLFAHLKKKPPR